MVNRIIFSGFALALLLTSGCASTVKPSGFLSGSGYEHLHQGQYVDRYWSDAELKPQALSKISIEEIDTSRITDQPSVTRSDAATWLTAAMDSSIRAQPSWQTKQSHDQPTARLFLAITYLTPGSAGGRMFAGELGMGHAIVQVEGKLIDASSNKELASFADRHRDSGSIGFEDIAGDVGPRLVRRMLEKMASDLVKELSASMK